MLGNMEADVSPTTGEHGYQGVNAEEVDLATNQIANPRLAHTKQIGGRNLRQPSLLDDPHDLGHER